MRSECGLPRKKVEGLQFVAPLIPPLPSLPSFLSFLTVLSHTRPFSLPSPFLLPRRSPYNRLKPSQPFGPFALNPHRGSTPNPPSLSPQRCRTSILRTSKNKKLSSNNRTRMESHKRKMEESSTARKWKRDCCGSSMLDSQCKYLLALSLGVVSQRQVGGKRRRRRRSFFRQFSRFLARDDSLTHHSFSFRRYSLIIIYILN